MQEWRGRAPLTHAHSGHDSASVSSGSAQAPWAIHTQRQGWSLCWSPGARAAWLGSGAEIWAVFCWFQRIYAIGSFVSSEPVRHSSRLLVLPGLGGSGISSCQDKQRPGHGLDWPFRPHRGSWCLASGPGPAYLCWWTGEHSAWGTSGLIACVLILRKGRGQCQQEHTSWACTTDVNETTEHTSQSQFLGGTLSSSSPSAVSHSHLPHTTAQKWI